MGTPSRGCCSHGSGWAQGREEPPSGLEQPARREARPVRRVTRRTIPRIVPMVRFPFFISVAAQYGPLEIYIATAAGVRQDYKIAPIPRLSGGSGRFYIAKST